MTKRIFAAVLLLCLFVSVVYAQSAATVCGWPPADGSVTNAKLAEPVSVANGGTGKTTAAAGLAALGGASLNGSSTVDFNTKNIYGAASSNSAPTYSFSGDTDTGIYSNSPDLLGLGAGGVSGLVTSGGNTAMGAAVDTGSRLRIVGNNTTHLSTALVEPPYKSMSVGSANYIDALKIGTQYDNIPVGVVDAGYRQGIFINNSMSNTNFNGTLTSLFGLRVNTGILSGTGTLTNCYGVFIKTASGTGIITNNWGLYQETAAARNYFAGRTLIGTNTDDGENKLQVNGNIKADKTLAADGTAAAPAYSFSSDPDTGIYSPGADTLGVSLGGELFFRLQSSGDCALIDGHTYNDTRLRLVSDATGRASDNGFMLGTIGSDTYLYNYSTGGMFFATSATERMRITSGGNVLIGTNTDNGCKLQVEGTGYFQNSVTAGNELLSSSLQVGSASIAIDGYDYNGKSVIQSQIYGVSYDNPLCLQPLGGNVLIATSTDDGANKLQVNGRIKATDIALNAPAVLAVSNLAFPVPNSVSTVATWTSEVYDDNSNFDYTTGIFTAPISGFYDVWAKSVWDANATGNRVAFFEKNASRERMPSISIPASSATEYPEFCLSGVIYLAAGDTLRLRLYQNSGGSLNTIGQANEGAISITYLRGR